MRGLSIIIIILLFFSRNCNSQVLVQDSIALVALYNSTNGLNWNNNSNWLDENLPVGDWCGITVEDYRVIKIYLSRNNLVGSIPSEIGNLQSLEEFDFSLNKVSSLPTSIGNCINLKRLQLNVNNLEEIPAEVGNLMELEYLIIAGNNINVLPNEVFNLPSLRDFYISANGMDTMPSLIGNLINLENFQFFNNYFTYIPEEIGNCKNLDYINGYGNNIDSLPLTLLDLPNVETLFLAYNSLTFDDIEPLVSIPGFKYWLQDSIGVSIDTTVFIDSTFYMEIKTDGEFNNYQWKKNNVIIEGATNYYLELSNITTDDTGRYNCEVTNDVASGLKLQSRLIDLQVRIYTEIEDINKDLKTISINIFPNPTSDKISIKIETESDSKELDVYLFNNFGELCSKYAVERSDLIEVNISNLDMGVYYIQLTDTESGYCSKIEKIVKI